MYRMLLPVSRRAVTDGPAVTVLSHPPTFPPKEEGIGAELTNHRFASTAFSTVRGGRIMNE